jgi:hypothetical protein
MKIMGLLQLALQLGHLNCFLISSIFIMYRSITIFQDCCILVQELGCVPWVLVFLKLDSNLCFAVKANLFNPLSFHVFGCIFHVCWYVTCLCTQFVFFYILWFVIWRQANGHCVIWHNFNMIGFCVYVFSKCLFSLCFSWLSLKAIWQIF